MRTNYSPGPNLDSASEIRVTTSNKLNARFKVNSASGEIIDATAAKILLSKPNQTMDFYELTAAVFEAFDVDGFRRLAFTRRMLCFRHDLESVRDRKTWLKSRVLVAERLIPSLVDATFMQFVLRLLSYFQDGLTEREIAQYWLEHHIKWFGDQDHDTVVALGSSMLDPILQSLLARQNDWEVELVQRLDPDGNVISNPALSAEPSTASPSDADPAAGPREQRHAVRWKCVTPFENPNVNIIVPLLLIEGFPDNGNHPVQGSLSYYLPAYNKFFLVTPNAYNVTLAEQFLGNYDNNIH